MGHRLNDLVEPIRGERLYFRDVDVRGVTCDSRQVQSGSLFVAVPGNKLDGTAFVEALAAALQDEADLRGLER